MSFYVISDLANAVAVYPESNEAAVKYGRPVVVVDPEDEAQVERLAALLWPHYAANERARLRKADVTADALREFAAPRPSIAEPTTLGAVVRDAEGEDWVLAPTGDETGWVCSHSSGPWSAIDAVEVTRP